jgi:hypothetical protein
MVKVEDYRKLIPEGNYIRIINRRESKNSKIARLYKAAQIHYIQKQERLYKEIAKAFGIGVTQGFRARTTKGMKKLVEEKIIENPSRAAQKIVDILQVFPTAPPCPVINQTRQCQVSTARIARGLLLPNKGGPRMLPKTPNSAVYSTPVTPRTRQRRNLLNAAVSQRTRAKTKK